MKNFELKKDIKMILESDTRKLLIFSFLFTIYIVIGALVFQALEIGNEAEEGSLIRETRKRLKKKYNISNEDWDTLASITKDRHPLGTNAIWSFGNAFIFAGSVVTTVGEFANTSTRSHSNGHLFSFFRISIHF